ncbi:MAG: hypothetical protein CM15mP122_2770 [Bacteroidota bacterium]|nr:MAG: hypothetical protein CM15mP122_2770 [Bacteroidota bacterium]
MVDMQTKRPPGLVDWKIVLTVILKPQVHYLLQYELLEKFVLKTYFSVSLE